MRIAFVGKGGSGKTTVASLFCRALADQGLQVLAVDADLNQHLGEALGLTVAKVALLPCVGDHVADLKEYLRGSNPRITSANAMIKTTPPGAGSRVLRLGKADPFLDRFQQATPEGVRLMNVGCFADDEVGVRCYHAKTGAVELILNHLCDENDQYVVVDMTAGVDAFASGLFGAFDLTFLVLEPTMKSVAVGKQYLAYAQQFNVDVRVVANKTGSSSDIKFIRDAMRLEPVAAMGRSAFVRKQDQGEWQGFEALERTAKRQLGRLVGVAQAAVADSEARYRRNIDLHRRNALSWGNAKTGEDLCAQIDPTFRPLND